MHDDDDAMPWLTQLSIPVHKLPSFTLTDETGRQLHFLYYVLEDTG